MTTIAVAGAGYVGTSLGVLLSQHNKVFLVDVNPERIRALQEGALSSFASDYEELFAIGELDIHPTLDTQLPYEKADFVVVAVPTDFDPNQHFFDISHVDEVVKAVLSANPNAVIVIKSTVPVGYTNSLCKRYPEGRFLFSPEFLREGKALYDNLHPSRIIVGIPDEAETLHPEAERFAALLAEVACERDVPTILMGAAEAEAVKLFSNTYLAMRVTFFNELDTFADVRVLDVASIVKGVCLDPRIGDFYNNPSFGYGGYCLPKDTKQLLANYRDVPQNLIGSIVGANRVRKDHICEGVCARVAGLKARGVKQPLVGIYRLNAKADSDNMRSSSMLGVMKRLAARNVSMLVYAPLLDEATILGSPVTHDLADFKHRANVIVANRMTCDLVDVSQKVYTRDLFGRD